MAGWSLKFHSVIVFCKDMPCSKLPSRNMQEQETASHILTTVDHNWIFDPATEGPKFQLILKGLHREKAWHLLHDFLGALLVSWTEVGHREKKTVLQVPGNMVN